MKKKENFSAPLLVVIALVFILVVYVMIQSNNQQNISYQTPSNSPTQSTQISIYESKDLQFRIQVPHNFQLKSSNTGLDLVSTEGSIEIIRNGTQFSTLKDYINDFDNKRNIKIKELENVNIAGYQSIKRREERIVGGVVKNPKVYYIWIDYVVYILSTDYEALFGDLDKIAQSFRYTP